MYQVAVTEAKDRFSELIDAAMVGEEVFIRNDDENLIQLILVKRRKRRPQFGSARGLITMAEDFDAPLSDFNEYMP